MYVWREREREREHVCNSETKQIMERKERKIEGE
jgi:hypothetical protein